MTEFKRVFSGAPWEKEVGYCRAIMVGNQVFVTGTAPINNDGSTYKPGEPYEQAKKCIQLIEKSIKELGLSLNCITRTRMFVTDISQWKEFGRAHSEFFSNYPPTTTMVEVSKLIDPEMLIEIEADGVIC